MFPYDRDEIIRAAKNGELSLEGALKHALERLTQMKAIEAENARLRSMLTLGGPGKFQFGDRVNKPKGSWWFGRVVGFYSTTQTPRGYCVQLITPDDNGPVQIYPESALEGT
jgi:R67 dihydrofolate reductase